MIDVLIEGIKDCEKDILVKVVLNKRVERVERMSRKL